MAPHDYTILGNWTATPPGLLVTLPGGHPGLNLGRLTSGPQPDWSLVSSLQQWRWREGGTRREANTASSIDLILHSYCCYSHLFFYISGLPLSLMPGGPEAFNELGDALAAHRLFVLCMPA